MAITARNVRALIKDVGPEKYRDHLRALLGVKVEANPTGRFPVRLNESEAQIHASEFSVRDLAYEFLGREAVEGLHSGNGGLDLREALNPVTSAAFQNINAFNQTVGGLIESRILKGYDLPEAIADKFFTTETTTVNGGKIIGIPNVTLPDGPTPEGQEYSEAGLTERWAIAPSNVKYTRKLALTREGVVYDRTGELLASGESMGMSLKYLKEYWCAAVAQGVDIIAGTAGFVAGRVANTYIYKGQPTDTPNATYQTAAGTGTSAKYNYVNSLTNALSTYANVQAVQAKLNLMREFETGYPILAPLEDIIVSPQVLYAAKNVIHGTQILQTAGANGLSGVGTGTFAPNPVPTVGLHSSTIWNKVLTDAGVSQTNADIRWFAGSFKRAFVWRSVWDMNVVQAAPNSPDMLDKDIVNAWYASWFGTPAVRDPHYVIASTE